MKFPTAWQIVYYTAAWSYFIPLKPTLALVHLKASITWFEPNSSPPKNVVKWNILKALTFPTKTKCCKVKRKFCWVPLLALYCIYIRMGLNFLVYKIDFMLFCHLGDILVLIPVGLDTSFWKIGYHCAVLNFLFLLHKKQNILYTNFLIVNKR